MELVPSCILLYFQGNNRLFICIIYFIMICYLVQYTHKLQVIQSLYNILKFSITFKIWALILDMLFSYEYWYLILKCF